jgi:hypothetical protein
VTEYYRHKATKDIYKLLFIANQGLVTTKYANKIYVLESEQNEVCTLQEQNFEKLMERYNPLVDWKELYEKAITFTLDISSTRRRKAYKKMHLWTYRNHLKKLQAFADKRLKKYEANL